jgi:hypothetical protein
MLCGRFDGGTPDTVLEPVLMNSSDRTSRNLEFENNAARFGRARCGGEAEGRGGGIALDVPRGPGRGSTGAGASSSNSIANWCGLRTGVEFLSLGVDESYELQYIRYVAHRHRCVLSLVC